MIKGIIFDLDGVLISTDKYHYQAWKYIADKEGLNFDEEMNNLLRGVSRKESLMIILSKNNVTFPEDKIEEMLNIKNEKYKELLNELTPESVDKEVIETLDFLKKSDIKLAIGSSSKNTCFILDKVNLTHYFDCIIDGNAITNTKPDPEVFIKAQEGLGLKKDECLVIEDARSGIDASINGEMKCCGIKDASNYEKATYKISSIKEIINIAARGIVLHNVSKVYPNGKKAVTDFSLEIDDKEFVVFVGPSGCGKSTVLRMIAGLEEITSGELIIDGVLSNDVESKERNIAMVFQNYALYPHYTVRQNIGFPLLMEKIPWKDKFNFKYRKERKEKINKRIEEVASTIGLSEYLDTKPKFLSGGQRQRVALGRAIIRNPRIFLLDEPLSNLDAKMRAQMRSEITTLHRNLQKTFIYVTHDQIEAMTMGSKIVVMKDGVIQQVSDPKNLYSHPNNMFVAGFIGTPQMNFIDAKLLKKGDKLFISNSEFNFELPKKYLNAIDSNYIDKDIVLGIRPKDIYTTNDLAYRKETSFKVKANIVESLGDDLLIYANMKNKKDYLILNTNPDSNIKEQEEIDVSFDLNHICLFDKETTKTIIDYEKLL